MSICKNFFRYFLVFSLALIWPLCISTLAQAKTYYVAKDGSDSNPGTETWPWLTIKKAADTMSPGDTVYVKAGTYSGVGLQISGTPGNYISYLAYPGDTVKVGQFYFYNGVSFIKVDGFDFANGNIECSGGNNNGNIFRNNLIHSGSGSGVDFGIAKDNIVENNEIWNVGHGVHTSGSTSGTIVKGNVIHDCYLHGLGMVGGIGEKYLNNIIYNCTKTGIHPGSGNPSKGEIKGNLVYNCGMSAIMLSGSGFLVENNTGISQNGAQYETYYISGSDHVVRNNIGYREDGVSYVLLISQSAITDYNDWYDPKNPKCISRWYNPMTLSEYQAYGQGAHSISEDPKFVNVAGNDFHLQPDSPCIGAGQNGVDMGAYGYRESRLPSEKVELRNRPNPFRAGKEETLIEYDLKQPSNVTITIYDLLGQEVWHKAYRAGENGGNWANSIPWDGRNLSGEVVANGGYICRIWVESENKYIVRKIAVAK